MILSDIVLDRFNNVLLVDDDDIVNAINKVMIEYAKFAENIIAKTSVDSALDFLKKLTKEDYPEVIFLDLELPVKNGWDFIAELKKMHLNIPSKIVMLTASISKKDEMKAKSMNEIVAYVPKPLSPELLHQIHLKHSDKIVS